MQARTRIVIAAALATTLGLAATPAYASPWSGNSIDFTVPSEGDWQVGSNPFTFDGPFSSAWSNTFDNSTFDDGHNFYNLDESWQLDCGAGDLLAATDGSGDQILTCDIETGLDLDGTGPLDVTAELRLYSDNVTVRMLVTITNPGSSPVTGASIKSLNNMHQDGRTNLEYSTTLGSKLTNWPAGNTSVTDVLTDADSVFVTDCPTTGCNPSDHPANVMQLFTAGSGVTGTLDTGYPALGGNAANDSAADTTVTVFALPSIAAGESVQILNISRGYFFLEGGTDPQTGANALVASTAAVAFAESGAWTGTDAAAAIQLKAGIADFSKVVNFNPAPPAVDPEALPNIGADTTSEWLFAGGAALLLLIGGLILVVRRRVTN